MTNRDKENEQVKLCRDAKESHSHDISILINRVLKAGHNVWLSSDWHLWKRVTKNSSRCKKRSDFDNIIKTYQNINPEDILIFLGDLVDGEFTDKNSLKKVLLTIPCTKILVRGNNDLFDNDFYKSCGFKYVTYAFKWNSILFSHMPQKHDCKMNIHGHLHKGINAKSNPEYWVPYKFHVDVFDKNRKPIKVLDAIKAQPAYARTVVVREDKFSQESVDIIGNIEWYNYFILGEDPCDD